MKQCIEINDRILVPQPWAQVLANSKKVPGELAPNGAFRVDWGMRPVLEQLAEKHILPPLMNPISTYVSKGPYQPWDYQRLLMGLYVAYTAAYNLADMGCVDAETEYLSPQGWKKISEYDGGAIATMVLDNGVPVFSRPTRYVRERYYGEWFELNTPAGSYYVTPGHRVPVSALHNNTGVEPHNEHTRQQFGGSSLLTHAGRSMWDDPTCVSGFMTAQRLFEHGGKGIVLAGVLDQLEVPTGPHADDATLCVPRTTVQHLSGHQRSFASIPRVSALEDDTWTARGAVLETDRAHLGDEKFCFTTDTGMWLMRRGTCVVLTGNSGKTGATLWGFDFLRDLGMVDRLLVIAPLSTLESAWLRDNTNCTPHLRATMLLGNKDARAKVLTLDRHDIVVINHDGAKVIEKVLVDWTRNHKTMVVVDEATAIAEPTTNRSKTMRHILHASTRRYLLTATPVVQHLMKAHGLLLAMDNNVAVPRSKTLFRSEFFVPAGPHQWVPKINAFERIQKLMAPAVRINTRDAHPDLPPNVNLHRWPPLTKEQQRAWDAMEETLVYEHNPAEVVTAANAGVRLGKLLQISCGLVRGEDSMVELPPTDKLDDLMQVIESANSKVLIFAPFTGTIDYLHQWLQDNFSEGCSEIIDGRVPAKRRGPIMVRFQDPDDPLQFIVAHPRAASHGLTLTEADTTVWFAPYMSAESFIQANQRIDRPGQKRHTRTVMMASTKLERDLYTVLLDKKATNSDFVGIYNTFIATKSANMAQAASRKR